MTSKRYTDEEIISSLEVIATTRNCNECKIRDCKWGTCSCEQITANAALTLVNRQKSEIDRQDTFIIEQDELISKLVLICNNSKAEAYKEFAERIKMSIKTNVVETLCNDVKGVCNAEYVLDDIDNLLKEMIGEEPL